MSRKSKKLDAELDKLYDAIELLMTNGCWDFLDDILVDKALQVWRIDLEI